MIYSLDIIKSLIRTEKSTFYEPQSKYLFLVAKSANKIQIKRAVEEIVENKVAEYIMAGNIGGSLKIL